jgi:hypothetical protein
MNLNKYIKIEGCPRGGVDKSFLPGIGFELFYRI